jgi:hypothetical protein
MTYQTGKRDVRETCGTGVICYSEEMASAPPRQLPLSDRTPTARRQAAISALE